MLQHSFDCHYDLMTFWYEITLVLALEWVKTSRKLSCCYRLCSLVYCCLLLQFCLSTIHKSMSSELLATRNARIFVSSLVSFYCDKREEEAKSSFNAELSAVFCCLLWCRRRRQNRKKTTTQTFQDKLKQQFLSYFHFCDETENDDNEENERWMPKREKTKLGKFSYQLNIDSYLLLRV